MTFVVLLLAVAAVCCQATLKTPNLLITFEESTLVVEASSGEYVEAGELFMGGETSYATVSGGMLGFVATAPTLGDNLFDKSLVLMFTSGNSDSLAYSGNNSFRVTSSSEKTIIEVLYVDGDIALGTVNDTDAVSVHSTGVSPLVNSDYCLVMACAKDTATCTSYVSANGNSPVSETVAADFDPFIDSENMGTIHFGYPMASYTGLALYPQVLSTDEDILEACLRPSRAPTTAPSASPSTLAPSESPSTMAPSESPTVSPTSFPSMSPTTSPTEAPSTSPSVLPSTSPTMTPSVTPTATPTIATDCDVSIVTQGGDGLSWDLTDDEGDEEIASGDLADSSASFTLGIGEDYLLFLSSSTLPSSATMNITVNGDSRVLELPAGTLLSTEIAGLTCEGLVDKISAADSAYTLVVGFSMLVVGFAMLA